MDNLQDCVINKIMADMAEMAKQGRRSLEIGGVHLTKSGCLWWKTIIKEPYKKYDYTDADISKLQQMAGISVCVEHEDRSYCYADGTVQYWTDEKLMVRW